MTAAVPMATRQRPAHGPLANQGAVFVFLLLMIAAAVGIAAP